MQKLWAGVCSFDASVPTRTAAEIEARLKHPAHERGAHWRVVIAGNGAIVGALEVGFIGTVRTEVMLAVTPAWRRQGVGRALLQAAPRRRARVVVDPTDLLALPVLAWPLARLFARASLPARAAPT